jgi:hypothetical protein
MRFTETYGGNHRPDGARQRLPRKTLTAVSSKKATLGSAHFNSKKNVHFNEQKKENIFCQLKYIQ